MADHEVFENKEDGAKNDERRDRVIGAFGSLTKTIGERASEREQERVSKLREAVISGDRDRVHEHLTTTKAESSWLYEELMKHPEISAIMRELSIMGL